MRVRKRTETKALKAYRRAKQRRYVDQDTNTKQLASDALQAHKNTQLGISSEIRLYQ